MAKIDSIACYYYCRQSGIRILIKFVQICGQQKQTHGFTELNNLFDLDLTIDRSPNTTRKTQYFDGQKPSLSEKNRQYIKIYRRSKPSRTRSRKNNAFSGGLGPQYLYLCFQVNQSVQSCFPSKTECVVCD
jgi:hypothetical protein